MDSVLNHRYILYQTYTYITNTKSKRHPFFCFLVAVLLRCRAVTDRLRRTETLEEETEASDISASFETLSLLRVDRRRGSDVTDASSSTSISVLESREGEEETGTDENKEGEREEGGAINDF